MNSKVKPLPMTMSFTHLLSIMLIASTFIEPISTTIKSVCLGIAMGLVVVLPEFRKDLRDVLSTTWCKSCLGLFLLILVSTIWSPAVWQEKIWAIEKYSKLLYLPLLVVGFRDQLTRRLSLHAFLLAMLITCIYSMIKYFGWFGCVDVDGGAVFRNHIMTSCMMAFAAYLCGFLFMKNRRYRVIYGFLFILFSYQLLFINAGRMGYLMYLGLMIFLIMQTLSYRQAMIAVVMVCSLFALSCYKSPVIQNRITATVTDWKNYHQNSKNTSIGYRMQFHQYAYGLFKIHPLIGHGTASFSHLFHLQNPVPAWGEKLLEPHSQYWLIASESGILGLLALFFFFIQLWRESNRLNEMRMIAMAILFPFIFGNLTDSLLYYSGSGYFFILFMALCLGESRDKNAVIRGENSCV